MLFFCLSCNNTRQKNGSRVEVLPFYKEASFTPHWFSKGNKKLSKFHKIPNFEFTNQDGEKVTQDTFKDKIYVTDFFFTTCPGICPRMTANMDIIQKEFLNDDEVLLLSHSVMPTVDSISVLKNYAKNKGVISGKWHLVTGNKEDIYNLGREFYFVEENLGEPKGLDDFLHTENFILVDKNKHIRGIYNGLNKASIAQLIIDIKALKLEE